jgi:prepilin-type N-terminal cleavage/methylation domain-containing protein
MSGIGKKAFTLVEVMIAATILAVGMIGVIRAYAAMVNTLEAADYSIESVCILKERMFEAQKKAIEEKMLYPSAGKIEGEYGDFEWDSQASLVDSSLEEEEEAEAGEAEEKSKKSVVMYLNKVKVTVSTEDVKPPRRLSLAGYVETYGKAE